MSSETQPLTCPRCGQPAAKLFPEDQDSTKITTQKETDRFIFVGEFTDAQVTFLEALWSAAGHISQATRKANVGRTTAYRWREENPDFARAWDEIDESFVDLAETALHQKLVEKDLGAICFKLKCKGKKRGYIERQEIEHGLNDQTRETLAEAVRLVSETRK